MRQWLVTKLDHHKDALYN